MRNILFFLAGLIVAIPVSANDNGVAVLDAWARATAPGQDSGAIQFSISSRSGAKLRSISSPLAQGVEIHEMTHVNGMMEMRAVEFIKLPAGQLVDLEATGKHVMLLKLLQPLKVGDKIPLKLTIELADKRVITVDTKAEVRLQGGKHNTHDR
jgi:copper(I)-binding protein